MPKKILFIRFSAIGDIVLTSAVLRCAKNQLHAEIHFLTKKENEAVVSANPFISKIHFLGENSLTTIGNLRTEKFDFIIDLHHNLRSFFIKTFLQIPAVSFYKLNIEKWLMVNFKINRLPNEHIVDRYFTAARKLGIFNDGLGLDFFIANKEFTPIIEEKKYICWAIGAKQKTKQFPVSKIVETLIHKSFPDFEVVLLGGKDDAEKGDEIVRLSKGKKVLNLAGKLSLQASAEKIKQSILLLTNDTGLMHIGAALQVPIISIWGNTIPEFGMYPYFGTHSSQKMEFIFVENLACRPCSKLGFSECPKGHFSCMLHMDTSLFIEKINSILFNKAGALFS